MTHKFFKSLPVGLFSLIVVAAILWLTLAPDPLPEEEMPPIPYLDKIGHFCMFGGLTFAILFDFALHYHKPALCGRDYPADAWNTRSDPSDNSTVCTPPAQWHPSALLMLSVVIAVILFGGFIEILQKLMNMGRGMELDDFIADIAGVLVAAAVSPCVIRYIFRHIRKPSNHP